MVLNFCWDQTETTLTIRFMGFSSSKPEVFVSEAFIKLSDPVSKKIVALDLVHDIKYKDPYTPILTREPHRLTVECFKSSACSWESLTLEPRFGSRNALEERRNSSIRDAEMYYRENELKKRDNRRHIHALIGKKLLSQVESRIEVTNAEKAKTRHEIEECIFNSTADEGNVRSTTHVVTCPVRRCRDPIIHVSCHKAMNTQAPNVGN